MRLVRVLLAAALVALPVSFVRLLPAYACSCAIRTLPQVVQDADLIVVGRAGPAQLTFTSEPTPLSPPSGTVRSAEAGATFAVDEYLKGSGPGSLDFSIGTAVVQSTAEDVEDWIMSAACQYYPGEGDLAILFLYRLEDGRYTTSTCSGSTSASDGDEARVLDRIAEVREILQGPATPTATPVSVELPPTGASRDGPASSVSWWAAAAIGAGALGAAGVLLGLRRGTTK